MTELPYEHITDDNPEAQAIWGNETARKEAFDSITPEAFKKSLVKLNAQLRGLNPDLHDFDGNGVAVVTDGVEGNIIDHEPPDQEDKEALIDYTLAVAQTLPNLQDSALLLAAGLNEIHPFVDANGRGSRILYSQLSRGGTFLRDNQSEIVNGRNGIDLGSMIPHQFLLRTAQQRLGEEATDRSIRAEAVRVLSDSFKSNSDMVLTAQDMPEAYRDKFPTQMSIPDYLRMFSPNLVTSKLRPKFKWEVEGDSQRQVFDGYREDDRFRKA